MSADSPLGLAQHKRCTFSTALALVVKLPCMLIEATWLKHSIPKAMICKLKLENYVLM